MEDLISFLKEYPIVTIFFLIWLFNALFGKKKKQADASKSATGTRAVQQKRPITAETTDSTTQVRTSFRDMIREAEERMKQTVADAENTRSENRGTAKNKLQGTAFNTKTAPEPSRLSAQRPTQSSRPAASSAPQESPDSPFAFHSLTDSIKPRIDYDQNDAAFSYHATVQETEEQEYHQDGFSNFHMAHGLTHETPATSPSPYAMPRSAPTDEMTIADRLFHPDDMQQLIIMKEILDKPRALR